jgi:fumarate reductase subunit D
MKHLLLRAEPAIWLLFGGGIMGGTILLTGWLLVVGIAAPLGLVPPEALDYLEYRTVTIDEGKITDTFEPFGVRAYIIRPD